MVKNKENSEDLDFWATNSEEGGWNISSTDEGSQKMNDEESEQQIKIQTGSDVVDDYFIEEENEKKARLLYSEIDLNPLFKGYSVKEDRSMMNATFTLANEDLKETFDTMWKEAGIEDASSLRVACERHEVAQIKGFGAKTEASILENLKFIKWNC